MTPDFDIKIERDVLGDSTQVRYSISNHTLHVKMLDQILREVITEVVKGVSAEYLRTHYGEIAAKLDTQAIANLSIASVASQFLKGDKLS